MLENFRKKYDFDSEIFDVLIQGKSIIDTDVGLTDSPLKSRDEVVAVVQAYGYDLNNPIESAELLGNFQEAIRFVRKYFLQPENPEGLRLEIPRRIQEVTDIADVFLFAGGNAPNQKQDPSGKLIQQWAISLLRVLHTIAHIDRDVRISYFGEIQKQIFDRFYRLVQRDDSDQLYLGKSKDDPNRVNLVAFDTKPKKPRDSVLIKLLHKPENVAEELFDRVGIRLVTHSRLDVLRLLKFLKDELVVVAANIKPSRSRNTLFNLNQARQRIAQSIDQNAESRGSEANLIARLEKDLTVDGEVSDVNPHTSEFYRSIQFTCRQLIKIQSTLYDDLRELKALSKSKELTEEVARMVEKLDLKQVQREIRFFYPFEVQIVDTKSHEENEKGRSAHSEYKKAQVTTAMKRIMRGLIES